MDQRLSKGSTVGLVLIGLGALLLLQTLGFIPSTGKMMMGLIFLGGGAVAGLIFLQDRRNWWAVFPAFMLGFIGFNILMDSVWPRFGGTGAIFLGGLGLCFLAVHALNRREAWPVIPGGILLSLAAVSAVGNLLPRFSNGWMLFAGWAVTFAAYYWVSGQRSRDQWALIVAAVCLGIGLLTLGGLLLKYLLPLALVLLGAYLLTNRQNP